MSHLSRLLGPAPNELELADWHIKLANLRDRVRNEMEIFRLKMTQSRRKHVPKKQTGVPDLDKFLWERNITYPEFLALAKAEKEKERSLAKD